MLCECGNEMELIEGKNPEADKKSENEKVTNADFWIEHKNARAVCHHCKKMTFVTFRPQDSKSKRRIIAYV